jgi:hypothetical protein
MKENSINQLYSDREDLVLKSAHFLKKFLIACLKDIIFLGLFEPDSKVKFIFLKGIINLFFDFLLKCGSMYL